MTCSEFISHVSDYVDGALDTALRRDVESHAETCESCRRYHDVVKFGPKLVRSLPVPELREDFEPRLQHRLYHVDEERHTASQSGAPVFTVFGIAVLFASIAWAPLLRGATPVADANIAPVVVDQPTRRQPVNRSPLPPLPRPIPARDEGNGDLDDGLWDRTRFHDYSPIQQRYNQRQLLRRASAQGR